MVFDWLFNRRCHECKKHDFSSSGHKCCDLMWTYNDDVHKEIEEDKEGVD
jgi:hypothetical protein